MVCNIWIKDENSIGQSCGPCGTFIAIGRPRDYEEDEGETD